MIAKSSDAQRISNRQGKVESGSVDVRHMATKETHPTKVGLSSSPELLRIEFQFHGFQTNKKDDGVLDVVLPGNDSRRASSATCNGWSAMPHRTGLCDKREPINYNVKSSFVNSVGLPKNLTGGICVSWASQNNVANRVRDRIS